ncbi:hypothetical protein QVA66_04955 [Staphylococcus chromogenes]|nr:hypothetical protein [Staphylococcus chromogenes]
MSVLFPALTPVLLAVFAMQMEKFEAFSTRSKTATATGAPDVSAEN